MNNESLWIHRLQALCQDQPKRRDLVFGQDTWSRGAIWTAAGRVAAHLVRLGFQRQQRVLIALPNGPEFVSAFLGVLRAGGVAIPLSPASGPGRIVNVLAGAETRFAMVDTCLRQPVMDRAQGRDLTLLSPLESPAGTSPPDLAVEPEDLCFIQYTSGSTREPRGVGITHANLDANLRSLVAGMRITEKDVFVSWLPVFHDMGLILMLLVPLTWGVKLVLLPTRFDGGRPWLHAIEQHRGTFTAAPDFSYRYVNRYLDHSVHFDLDSLRVALNAAEPVRASTIARFEHRFGLRHVVIPGYGLAEATVGVATWPPNTPVESDAQGCVSVGPPLPGVQVRIARIDDVAPGARGIGEIEVGGAAATAGYVANTKATRELMTSDGFVRTGDLGYLDEQGRLTVTARRKEMIKQAGVSIAPPEVEEIVDGIAGIRRSAAVGIDGGGAAGEQLYVFAELESGDVLVPGDITVAIVKAVHDHLGMRPGRVVLVPPRALPYTANGKVQRGRIRTAWLQGALPAIS